MSDSMYGGGSYNNNGRGGGGGGSGGGGGGRYGGRQNNHNHHHNSGPPQQQPYSYGPQFPAQPYQQFHPQQQQYLQHPHHQAMAYHQAQQQPAHSSGPPNPYGMYGMQQQPYPQQQGWTTPLSPTPSHYQQQQYHQQQHQLQHQQNLSESLSQMSIEPSSHPGSTAVTPPSGQVINGTTTYVHHAPSSSGGGGGGGGEGIHSVPPTPLSPSAAALGTAAAASSGPSSMTIPGAYGLPPPPPIGVVAPVPPPPHIPPGIMPGVMGMGMGIGVPMGVQAYGPPGLQPNMGGPMSRAGTSGPNPYQQPQQHFGGGGGSGPAQQIYLGAGGGGVGPGSGSTMGPSMGAAEVNAGAEGPSALPALPLSARFPPLPPRPDIPAPPLAFGEADADSKTSTAEIQESGSESDVQLYATQLRQALDAYQARDEAWALRMEAIGFEPARAYVAAVLEDRHQANLATASIKDSATRDDATPTVDQQTDPFSSNAEQKGAEKNDEEAQLRSAVGRRGFAPVLGLRLLQRIHKLETENAELHGVLVGRLQLDGGDQETKEAKKTTKDGNKREQPADVTKGKKETGDGPSGLGLSEDRAKATVQLLENELQDAHALIAALSNALKVAESK